jgi:hypothetical protein
VIAVEIAVVIVIETEIERGKENVIEIAVVTENVIAVEIVTETETKKGEDVKERGNQYVHLDL